MPSVAHATSSEKSQIAGTQFLGDVTRRISAHGAVLSALSHPHPRTIPCHEHEHSYFSLLLRGDYGEAGEPIAPVTVCFLPIGGRHDGMIGPKGAEFFTIEIAESWLDGLGSGRDRCSPLMGARGSILWSAMRLYCSYQENGTADSLLIQELIMELAACAARETYQAEHQKPSWLKRITESITDRFDEEFELTDLAAEVGVHPVHLGRTFRKFHGTTLGMYLHHLRVQRACELLRDPDPTLAEIAMQTGFSDQPHFTRVFRTLTGTTPGRFRASAIQMHNKSRLA